MQGLSSLLPFILMFVVFYFLLIRPQQKRSKERNSMLGALKKGDQIVTIGGLHGTITEINEETATIRVADNTKLKFERSAIASVKAAAQPEAATTATE